MNSLAIISKRAAKTAAALFLAISAIMAGPSGAKAGVEPFLGEIMLFAGNFCPRGYADCSGQLMSIAQNTALFSILGTTYGGNGQTTFALPNLNGRVPIGDGAGLGLTPRSLGEASGSETETLTTSQIPAHNHSGTFSQPASSAAATKGTPENNIPAVPERSIAAYSDAVADKSMRSGTVTVGAAGGSQPHNNMQPYLALKYCIAMEGIFPSRN